MSKRHRCRHGIPDCDLDGEHQLTLAGGIMHMIAQYNKRKDIVSCPSCLRDTMLAVAALLHLDAARIASERAGKPRAGAKHVSDALAKAAREALENVAEAKATMPGSHSKH